MDYVLMRKRLVNARTWMGLNRKDFANELKMSYRTITNYENGSREPGSDYISKVADYCGVTTDWLLGLTDEPHMNLSDLDRAYDMRIQNLVTVCRDLNENAVNKVISYAEDLAWNPANKKPPKP